MESINNKEKGRRRVGGSTKINIKMDKTERKRKRQKKNNLLDKEKKKKKQPKLWRRRRSSRNFGEEEAVQQLPSVRMKNGKMEENVRVKDG